MTHDAIGLLKIALVVLGSALALGAIAGFYDGRAAGWRAFWFALAVCVLVGLLQAVQVRFLGWTLGVYGLLVIGGFSWWCKRRAR